MIRGKRYERVLLVCLVLCLLYAVPCYAEDYVLDPESFSVPETETPIYDPYSALEWDEEDYEDGYEPDMELINDLDDASPSNASKGGSVVYVTNNIAPASVYPSVDDGSISTSILQYFKDIAVRLPYGSDYVLFRVNDYEYRLVYGDIITLSGTRFTGTGLSYVRYYRTNNYSVYYFDSGSEGNFSLETNGMLVYTNVGLLYPELTGGVYRYEIKACLFVLVLGFLFTLLHSFFFLGKYRI